MEVEEVEPHTPALKLTIGKLRYAGIHCVFGKWLIPGAPYVLLFDIGSAWHRLAEWKADLWNIAGVPSPENDTEMNDAVIFGYLISWFLGEVRMLTFRADLLCFSSFWSRKILLNLALNLNWILWKSRSLNLLLLPIFMNGLLELRLY